MHRRSFLQRLIAAAAMMPLAARTQTGGLPRSEPVPGGVALVALGPADLPPLAWFDGARVLVAGDSSGWLAVVGIPLGTRPGNAPPLTVERASGVAESIALLVGPKRYATQRLTVKPGQVDLSPEDLARYERERAHLQNVRRTFTESAPESLLLVQPCEGPRSDSFGKRRFFNDRPRNPHNGLDIAAPLGTPVIAAGGGEVIDVGDYFFSGQTVVLNHGQGFLTLYAHLSRTSVAAGERIAAATPIGEVGATGRVTGPHLHFGVFLNAAKAVEAEGRVGVRVSSDGTHLT
ncbi:MAG: peptidoglycan DD-metalloendopeptidase family protein, partial [Burkholderiales bacterium]